MTASERELSLPSSRPRVDPAGLPALLLTCLYAIVVLRTAWIEEDAFITFRTIDNFFGGHGLRWNVVERVQTYTHPLWMFVLSGAHAISGEFFYTAIAVCVVLSFAAVILFVWGVAPAGWPAAVGVSVFVFSKAFVDYSTSGLENPLTHLLLMGFYWRYLTPNERKDGRRALQLGLLAGLVALNRLDCILLVLPALLVEALTQRNRRTWARLALGFVPLAAWLAFSLVYYGFLFPNTAYAKLQTGLDRPALMQHGLLYLLRTLELDPLTLMVLAAGIVSALLWRERRALAIGGGVLAYLLYVVSVGGDFMLGRFLSAPLVGAVVVLVRWPGMQPTTALVTLAIVGVAGVMSPRAPIFGGLEYGLRMDHKPVYGITDERSFFFQYTGLMQARRGLPLPTHAWARNGREARASGEEVARFEYIGMFGFFAGPDVYVLDEHGLGDPLLARLLPDVSAGWRVGHLRRRLPEGYLESLPDKDNRIADPKVADYYDKLRQVTRGPLFTAERWRAILSLNLTPALDSYR